MAAAPALAGREQFRGGGGQRQFLNINFALLLLFGVANAKDEITLHCFSPLRLLLLLPSSPSSSSTLGTFNASSVVVYGDSVYRLRVQLGFYVELLLPLSGRVVAHLRLVKITEIIIQNQMVYLVWFYFCLFYFYQQTWECLPAVFYCFGLLFATDKLN